QAIRECAVKRILSATLSPPHRIDSRGRLKHIYPQGDAAPLGRRLCLADQGSDDANDGATRDRELGATITSPPGRIRAASCSIHPASSFSVQRQSVSHPVPLARIFVPWLPPLFPPASPCLSRPMPARPSPSNAARAPGRS